MKTPTAAEFWFYIKLFPTRARIAVSIVTDYLHGYKICHFAIEARTVLRHTQPLSSAYLGAL
jgi:hypothetical protein